MVEVVEAEEGRDDRAVRHSTRGGRASPRANE